MSRRFKIERDCYEDKNYLYKKGHVTFQPGLTVLVGLQWLREDNPDETVGKHSKKRQKKSKVISL